MWDGYFSDFDRNFAIHHASDEAHETHHRLYDPILAKPDTPLVRLNSGKWQASCHHPVNWRAADARLLYWRFTIMALTRCR